jgi:two-component system phosphate regulon sensor histidine kinase PhoR
LSKADKQQPLTHFIRSEGLKQFLASSALEYQLLHHQHYFCLRRIELSPEYILISIEKQDDQLKRIKAEHDFIASVSHEMNTPITVISGYIDLLKEDIIESKHQLFFKTIEQQTERLRHLAHQLLQLLRAEQQTVRFTWIDGYAFFERLQLETEALNIKNLIITWEIDEHLDLYGDENLLYTAFRNLIDNAIHYTPLQEGKIWIRWYAARSYSFFEVEDTGVGIAAEYIPKLGERFFRIHTVEDKQGSGLGLSLVKRSLQQHNAEWHIHSKQGQGSLFKLQFKQNLA